MASSSLSLAGGPVGRQEEGAAPAVPSCPFKHCVRHWDPRVPFTCTACWDSACFPANGSHLQPSEVRSWALFIHGKFDVFTPSALWGRFGPVTGESALKPSSFAWSRMSSAEMPSFTRNRREPVVRNHPNCAKYLFCPSCGHLVPK